MANFSLFLCLLLATAGVIMPHAQGLLSCPTDLNSTRVCFPPGSAFANEGCGCCEVGTHTQECTDASSFNGQASGDPGHEIECPHGGFINGFPLVTDEEELELLKGVTCIVMSGTDFTVLEAQHMRQFPNLIQLYLNNGKLKTIEDGAFSANPKLQDLEISNNDLTVFPPVHNLTKLDSVDVSNNRIRSLAPGDLRNCIELGELIATHNDIRELRDGVFADTCTLSVLYLNHNNKLSYLGDNLFVGTRLLKLDMSHTSITKVPYEGIRGTLTILYLEETRNLKKYSPFMGSPDVTYEGKTFPIYRGKTFPLLEEVRFYYPAFCCRMKTHTYLTLRNDDDQRRAATRELVSQIRPERQADLLVTVVAEQVALSRKTRETGDAGLGSGDSPLDPTSCYSPEAFPSMLEIEVCSSSVSASVSPSLAPSPSPSPSLTVSQSCSVSELRVSCRSLFATANTPSPTPTPSPSMIPCPDVCDSDYCNNCPSILSDRVDFCDQCKLTFLSCSSSCDNEHPGICACRDLRRRSALNTRHNTIQQLSPRDTPERERRADGCVIPEGYFFPPNTTSTDVICSLAATVPTPTTSGVIPPQTANPVISTPVPMGSVCDRGTPSVPDLIDSGVVTQCSPGPDAFNPCEDLLGDTDTAGIFLRIGIWVVIVIAVLGNGLVIVVIVGHSFILRRSTEDTFLMHFLYVNLAVADFILGVYLFTIAVVDLDTLGRYHEEAVKWQTGHGCGFAGFCAITSTVVSVYTLAVITFERVYTIVNVFQKRKMYKFIFFVIMAFGWVLGVVMGMLPLVGVNSYSVVAICLPFDVTEMSGKVYVAFLLLATGLVFVAIAVSYCIIFYQVFCGRSKRRINSAADRKLWKTEIKVGFRMSLLVFTNFICWFPIALLALTAAFGESLVDVSTAKFFMVFFFPINACLNPILYSLSTKTFRQNLCLLLGRCGLFKGYNRRLRTIRAGVYTPSVTSNSIQPGGRRGTIMQRLLSISSIRTSTTSGGRRDSAMSQGSFDDHARFTARRASNFSAGSDDQLLAVRNPGARRSSSISAGSLEDTATTFQSWVRASSPQLVSKAETSLGVSGAAGAVKPKLAVKVSASSLGAVPEEAEIAPTPTPDLTKFNPAYTEEEEEEEGYYSERKDSDQPSELKTDELIRMEELNRTDDLVRTDKDVVLQHHIVAEALPDSGQVSASPSIEEGVEMTVLKTLMREEGGVVTEEDRDDNSSQSNLRVEQKVMEKMSFD